MQSIKNFYALQSTGKQFDMFEQEITIDTELMHIEGWLQDVERDVKPDSHTITLLILDRNKKDYHKVTRTCEAKEGCHPDWDEVLCAWFGADKSDDITSISTISTSKTALKS